MADYVILSREAAQHILKTILEDHGNAIISHAELIGALQRDGLPPNLVRDMRGLEPPSDPEARRRALELELENRASTGPVPPPGSEKP